jgi:integral membrane sensor domain MASE1
MAKVFLMKSQIMKPRIGAQEVALVAMSAAIYYALAVVASVIMIIPGVTLFYYPEATAMVTVMWFGIWGALAAWIGTILLSPFYGYGYPIGAMFGFFSFYGPLIAGIILRKLHIDLTLKDKRSFIWWILIAAVIAPAIEGAGGVLVFILEGWYTWQFAYTYGWFLWWFGEVTAVGIIGTILMRVLSKFIMRSSLFHKGLIYRESAEEESAASAPEGADRAVS